MTRWLWAAAAGAAFRKPHYELCRRQKFGRDFGRKIGRTTVGVRIRPEVHGGVTTCSPVVSRGFLESIFDVLEEKLTFLENFFDDFRKYLTFFENVDDSKNFGV